MSNILYPKYKEALLAGGVNLVAGAVKVALVDTGAYTFSPAHQFLSSVPTAARIGAPGVLANKTVSGGVFNADPTMLASVPAGSGTAAASEALVLYRDSGTDATSELIAFWDSATGLPLVTNGGNVSITWNAGGIFNL
ncbi:hypothetical protein [Sphingomonas sp. CARO-RG-8B-R24-01]|uniref:hypothetical protein n=1 Tax=Sphingomonas sp. CARO-RG-8B-R24-01 TaxID=2914831 RepID=UPI001F56262C|nr:hypothetical protein [Sphingomonas sp. CARO-RG-8B-R24-01]